MLILGRQGKKTPATESCRCKGLLGMARCHGAGTSHPRSHGRPNLTSKPSSSKSAGAHRLCSDGGRCRCLQALQSCFSSPCPAGLLKQGLFTISGENQPRFGCWQPFRSRVMQLKGLQERLSCKAGRKQGIGKLCVLAAGPGEGQP